MGVDPTGRPYWYLLTNKHWFKNNYRIAALSLSYMLTLPVRHSTLWLVKCHEFKLCLSKWRTWKWAISTGGGRVSLLQDGRGVQAPDGAGCKLQDVWGFPRLSPELSFQVASCENHVHAIVNNYPFNSGLGLSGDFSVPLSDHEGGSVSRPSTQVEILCMKRKLFEQ